MKKVVKCIFILSLLWCQLAFTSPFDLRAPSRCDALLSHVHHALLTPPTTDPKDDYDPVRQFRSQFPEVNINAKDLPFGLYQFETDVFDLITGVAPQFRKSRVEAFRAKWNLTEEQAFDFLAYYGSKRFFNNLKVVTDDPRLFYSRLRVLSKQQFLQSNHPAARRYKYYNKNITRLSVPEMAKALRLSEGAVYRELGLLNLSIVEAFQPYLEEVQDLLHEGLSIDHIANRLGIGARALEFVLHHTNQVNRGVSWDRIFNLYGQDYSEIQLLIILRTQEHLNAQEIADRLNQLAGTPSNIGDADMRTEASVQAKLSELGLTEEQERGEPEIYHFNYGYLKKHGQLVSEIAIEFIFDHYEREDEWIAEALDVTVEGLRAFYQRHHLVRQTNAKRSRFTVQSVAKDDETAKLLDRYAKQVEAVDKIVGWIKENPDETVTANVIKSLGINPNAFLGIGGYKLNPDGSPGPSYLARLFDSPLTAWLAVKERANAEGLKFGLIDVQIKTHHLTQAEQLKFREIRKEEAVDRIVEWIKASPDKTVTVVVLKSLGIIPDSFFGTGNYQLNPDGSPGLSYSARLFDSLFAAWLAVKEKASAQGLKFGLINVEIKIYLLTPDEQLQLRKIKQEEAVDRTVEWIRENPDKKITHRMLETLGINHQAFFGTGDYRLKSDGSPGRAYSARLFDSREQAIEACRERIQQEGIPFPDWE